MSSSNHAAQQTRGLVLAWVTALACSVVLVGLAGCTMPARSPEQQKREADRAEVRRVEQQAKYLATLPTGVTDVRDEGGDNVSFTLTRDGRTHRYLAHYAWDYRNGIFQSTLVRLD